MEAVKKRSRASSAISDEWSLASEPPSEPSRSQVRLKTFEDDTDPDISYVPEATLAALRAELDQPIKQSSSWPPPPALIGSEEAQLGTSGWRPPLAAIAAARDGLDESRTPASWPPPPAKPVQASAGRQPSWSWPPPPARYPATPDTTRPVEPAEPSGLARFSEGFRRLTKRITRF